MKLEKLSSICDLQNGFAFKSSDYIEFSNTLCCRMSNIRPNANFDIDYNPKYLPDNYSLKYNDYLLKDGDLIIAMTDMASDPKILGVPTQVITKGKTLLLNQRVGKLINFDTKKVHIPYVKLALARKELKEYYKKFSGGGIQLNISKQNVLNIRIPIPPIEDQIRITEILTQAENLIAQRKKSIKLLDKLLKSTFLEMFGDPVRNDKVLRTEKLSNICDVASSRRVFVDELVDKGIPFFRGTEIGKLAEGKKIIPTFFITKEHYEYLKKQTGVPKIGDLLMPSICPDGRIHMISDNKPFYFKDGRVLWIKVHTEKINARYLMFFLKELFVRNYNKIASGTTFAELKIVALKQINIPLPNIILQEKFAKIVETIEILKNEYKASLKELENMYGILSQKAFKGDLNLSKVIINTVDFDLSNQNINETYISNTNALRGDIEIILKEIIKGNLYDKLFSIQTIETELKNMSIPYNQMIIKHYLKSLMDLNEIKQEYSGDTKQIMFKVQK